MAKGTNGIATRENVNGLKPGTYTSDLKRCVSYSSVTSQPGLKVINADRYVDNPNRLVRYEDIQAKFIRIRLIIDISSDPELYDKGPLTLCTTYGPTYQTPGMRLYTGGSSTVENNLLNSTYSQYSLTNKKVTFLFYYKIYDSTALSGTYHLMYPSGGYPVQYLKNREGAYPVGRLLNSSSDTSQAQSITISGEGDYVFNAYWEKMSLRAYTFRLRLNFSKVQSRGLYQVKVTFKCEVYASSGTNITSFTINGSTYNIGSLASETTGDGSRYFYMNLTSSGNLCTTIPYFVKVTQVNIQLKPTSSSPLYNTVLKAINQSYSGTSPNLGSTNVYYSEPVTTNIFSMNYSIESY